MVVFGGEGLLLWLLRVVVVMFVLVSGGVVVSGCGRGCWGCVIGCDCFVMHLCCCCGS